MESGVLRVSSFSFQQAVLGSEKPFVLALVAPWCRVSRLFGPVLEEVAVQKTSEIRVGQTDVGEDPALARLLHINIIPTVSLYRGGELVDSLVGAGTAAEVLRWIHERCNGGAHEGS